jgi:hypothetical protein
MSTNDILRILNNEEVLEWLLEKNNPSVRYWALLELKGLNNTSPEVVNTRKEIISYLPVNTILSNQQDNGFWVQEGDMYLPKYTATTHQLLILAELGLPRNSQIEKSIEHIYKFQRNSGHFLTTLPKTERGKNSVVKDGCCFDGNILFYLIQFGYLNDPRTVKLLDFIIDYYDFDDGGWHCRAYPINPDGVFPKNCYMGATKILKAFSYMPKEKRTEKINQIIEKEVEKILRNRVHYYLRNSDGSRKLKSGWKRFGFPLFYQTDILEVLDTLTRLGIKDSRMKDALNFIIEQIRDDKWYLKNTFNEKMWVDIEEKNKPSKWITLRALRVLKRWNKL